MKEEDMERALISCGFSEEMRTYLISNHLISDPQLIDIVCQAPISLEEKYHTLASLIRETVLLFLSQIEKEGNGVLVLAGLDSAMREIYCAGRYYGRDYKEGICFQSERVLCLFEEWYDTDSFVEKSFGAGMFRSMSNVLQYIAREEAENDTGEGWYRVEAWAPGDEEWKEERYDYYLFNGETCWFEKLYPKKQNHGNIYYMPESRQFSSGNLELNLPTPYKTGDIVLIDCRPFGPPFHAMILESRDQWDCCHPNIVFQVPYTDKWRITPLKHKRFFKHAELSSYAPMLSPLYRIRKVRREEMTEEDDRLLKLSDFLSGKESRAAAVWEAWTKSPDGDKDFEEVASFFAEAGAK